MSVSTARPQAVAVRRRRLFLHRYAPSSVLAAVAHDAKTNSYPARLGEATGRSLRGELGGRLVGQLDTVAVDDDLAAGILRDASGGPDRLIKRVKRDEDALHGLDRHGPVVAVLHNVNVSVSHAEAGSHPLRTANVCSNRARYRAGRSMSDDATPVRLAVAQPRNDT